MLLDFQVLFAYPVDRHGDVNFCDKTNKTIRSYRGFAALYKCPATTAHPFIIRLVRSNTYGARSETIKSNPSNGHLPRAPANGHIAVGISSTMQYADVFLIETLPMVLSLVLLFSHHKNCSWNWTGGAPVHELGSCDVFWWSVGR